jgi:hypothetical protein
MDFGREPEPTRDETAREERIKRLILAAVPRCGACQRSYAVTDFAVVGHREHLWMITVQCAGCQHQGFITAVVEGHGIEERHTPQASRAEFFTEERPSTAHPIPVTVDDLLDLHDFLDEFDGDFAGLFERRKDSANGGHD